MMSEAAEIIPEEPTWKPKKLSFVVEKPEDGEIFLRGLLIAEANNSSPLFPQLIEVVNSVLEPYRAAKVTRDIAVRDRALEGL
jgi:hypothetical protein